MSDRHSSARRQSVRMAYCGMAAGLSVVIMLLGGVIPAATYAVPMLCGLMLLPILLEFDARSAWITYFVVAALALILGFDKEAAFFYIFMGYYPIVKWRLDRIRRKGLRLAAKIGLFTAAITAMYALLLFVFPIEALREEFAGLGTAMTVVFVAVHVLSMLLYDRLLLPMSLIYVNWIRPKLHLK
ncbi:MAG: hypothetical protein IJ240_00965 [Clostridia bacterium]|nr:hypothetical protein [Clostridia bacterium]